LPKARVQKRLYYKIGEACKALGIQPYVLRYWETEFPALSPSKSRSGQRVYSEKELEVIRRIKQLLYDEGYTIAGAKKKLEGELAAGTLGDPAAPPATPPHSPPPPPAVFQAPAAGRVRGQAAESERAGGGLANGAAAGGPATNAVPGAARTVPLPLAPWAPAVDKPEADKPRAAAASPEPAAPAAPAAPARRDGQGGVSEATAADASAGTTAEAQVPAPTTADLGESPHRPTLPLTPPWPPLQAVPAPAAASPQGAAAKAASPTPRKAAAHQAPAAATPATAAGDADRASRPVAATAPSPASSAPGHELDTAAAKQIETLRKGIIKALQGAREILALLDSRSPR
jgi:DNA-binding transcriptional MerR regulator